MVRFAASMVVTRCWQLTQLSRSISAWTPAANSHAKTLAPDYADWLRGRDRQRTVPSDTLTASPHPPIRCM
jgi:poly(3-hydroxyalkanoate) synthetase